MRRRHLALGRRRRRLRLGGGRGGGGRGGREFAHDTLVLLLPFLFHLLELGLAHHRVEAGAEVARHALGLADPVADRAHDARQILGSDHDQRDQGHDQQFGRRYVEHSAPPFRRADQGSRRSSGRGAALLSAGGAAGGGASTVRPPSMRRGSAGFTSSSVITFLTPLLPLATSPTMSEKRPLPNNSKMMTPTTSQIHKQKTTN